MGTRSGRVEQLEQGAVTTREVVDGVVAARNMDDRQRGMVFPEAVNGLSAAHAGHVALGPHEIEGFSGLADESKAASLTPCGNTMPAP